MNRVARLCMYLILLLPLPCVSADITLTNGEWPPYLTEYEPGYGIASRIVTDAFAEVGIRVNYVFRPWKRAYKEAEAGIHEGSVVWSYEEERAQKFLFSDSIFEGQSVFFHLKRVPFQWQTYDDLARFRIGGSLGYEYEFEKLLNIKVTHAGDDLSNFRKLLAGHIDIFPSDREVGYAILRRHFSKDELAQFTHHPKVYNSVTYHLILNKQHARNAGLMVRFNQGLKKLRDSGKYNGYFPSFARP
ncbi:transporter substrate-binding domain-containing protein [Chitinivorax sp. B]|uniref:substrate-binding periplasmic protein n=1 Tax=Chitinivorax sp. B TaxID=2502235 RepID=UPI0010F76361|nr:transporter substrate-binding domain-containing protein [Chitinivorax sp. B]